MIEIKRLNETVNHLLDQTTKKTQQLPANHNQNQNNSSGMNHVIEQLKNELDHKQRNINNIDNSSQKYYTTTSTKATTINNNNNIMNEHFDSMERQTPMLINDASKFKSSLIKRGSLAQRQLPQQQQQHFSNDFNEIEVIQRMTRMSGTNTVINPFTASEDDEDSTETTATTASTTDENEPKFEYDLNNPPTQTQIQYMNRKFLELHQQQQQYLISNAFQQQQQQQQHYTLQNNKQKTHPVLTHSSSLIINGSSTSSSSSGGSFGISNNYNNTTTTTNNNNQLYQQQSSQHPVTTSSLPCLFNSDSNMVSFSQSVEDWSVECVCQWLSINELSNYIELFKSNFINGEALVSLDNSKFKVNHTKRMNHILINYINFVLFFLN
jgi:hypothetical protein